MEDPQQVGVFGEEQDVGRKNLSRDLFGTSPVLQSLRDILSEFLESVRNDGQDELLFAAKMGVQGALGYARAFGDVLDARLVQPLVAEQPAPREEQISARG